MLDERRPEEEKNGQRSPSPAPLVDSLDQRVEDGEAETLVRFDLLRAASNIGGELGQGRGHGGSNGGEGAGREQVSEGNDWVRQVGVVWRPPYPPRGTR